MEVGWERGGGRGSEGSMGEEVRGGGWGREEGGGWGRVEVRRGEWDGK